MIISPEREESDRKWTDLQVTIMHIPQQQKDICSNQEAIHENQDQGSSAVLKRRN